MAQQNLTNRQYQIKKHLQRGGHYLTSMGPLYKFSKQFLATAPFTVTVQGRIKHEKQNGYHLHFSFQWLQLTFSTGLFIKKAHLGDQAKYRQLFINNFVLIQSPAFNIKLANR